MDIQIGQKFGKLTILDAAPKKKNYTYWKCKCECGEIKDVYERHIKSGATKTCGNCKKRQYLKIQIGDKFDKWEVIGQPTCPNGKDVKIECKCCCGKIKVVFARHLMSGMSKSCGCSYKLKPENFSGKRFGRLLAIEQKIGAWDKIKYLCKCDCGNEKIISHSGLSSGKVNSCGCLHKESISTHGKTGTIQYNVFRRARERAEKRGIEFSISIDDIVIPSICPILGIKLQCNGRGGGDSSYTLDRIDVSKGYVPGNIIVISMRANTLKNNASLEELFKISSFYYNKVKNKTQEQIDIMSKIFDNSFINKSLYPIKQAVYN